MTRAGLDKQQLQEFFVALHKDCKATGHCAHAELVTDIAVDLVGPLTDSTMLTLKEVTDLPHLLTLITDPTWMRIINAVALIHFSQGFTLGQALKETDELQRLAARSSQTSG